MLPTIGDRVVCPEARFYEYRSHNVPCSILVQPLGQGVHLHKLINSLLENGARGNGDSPSRRLKEVIVVC